MKKLVFGITLLFVVPCFAQNAALLEEIKTYPPEMQPDMSVQRLAAPMTIMRYVTGQGYRPVNLPAGTEVIMLLGKPYADANGFLRQAAGNDEPPVNLEFRGGREEARDG